MNKTPSWILWYEMAMVIVANKPHCMEVRCIGKEKLPENDFWFRRQI